VVQFLQSRLEPKETHACEKARLSAEDAVNATLQKVGASATSATEATSLLLRHLVDAQPGTQPAAQMPVNKTLKEKREHRSNPREWSRRGDAQAGVGFPPAGLGEIDTGGKCSLNWRA